VKVIRIYTGVDEESHFEDLEIPQTDGRYGAMSDMVAATGIFFRTTPQGQSIDYHTAPRRQFVITLAGVAEIETGDGSTLRLEPGDILLADDTTGHGHISRDIKGPRRSIFVPIPDDLDISSWGAS
jgi:Cupin domain